MWSLLPIAISCLFLSASSLLSNGADYGEIQISETYQDHKNDNASIETLGRILGKFTVTKMFLTLLETPHGA